MQYSKYILIASLCVYFINNGATQTLNWNKLENTRHILSANFGLDFGLTSKLTYGYKFNTYQTFILGASISKPAGKTSFDDFKASINGQIQSFSWRSFKGSTSFSAIYRKQETSLVTLQNFGAEIKGTCGYYRSKWFIAAELGFDKAIVTHFKHTDKYRDEFYLEVKDGWYQPATGGNFYYGSQAGYSIKNMDITLNVGKIINQDFITSPVLPFYFNLGFNFKI